MIYPELHHDGKYIGIWRKTEILQQNYKHNGIQKSQQVSPPAPLPPLAMLIDATK